MPRLSAIALNAFKSKEIIIIISDRVIAFGKCEVTFNHEREPLKKCSNLSSEMLRRLTDDEAAHHPMFLGYSARRL